LLRLLIALQWILDQERVSEVARHRIAREGIERVEIPAAWPREITDEFWFGPQSDFLARNEKGSPVDVCGSVGAKPYDQLRDPESALLEVTCLKAAARKRAISCQSRGFSRDYVRSGPTSHFDRQSRELAFV
jgi:hypothetical protein